MVSSPYHPSPSDLDLHYWKVKHWPMQRGTSFLSCKEDGEFTLPYHQKPVLTFSLAGSIFAAPITTYIGRQKCLLLNCIFFLLGAAIMTASTTLPMCKSSKCGFGPADNQSWEVDSPSVSELEPCPWSALPTSPNCPLSTFEDVSLVFSKSSSLSE